MWKARRPLVTLVAVLLAGGCSSAGGDQPDRGGEPPAAVSAKADTPTLTLPLDGYIFSPAEFQTVVRAQQRLAQDCMRRFGFQWNPPPETNETDTKPVHHERQWGNTDEARAEQYGYHPTPADQPQLDKQKRVATLKQQERDNPMSPALQNVLMGGQTNGEVNGLRIPDGGCLGEALRTVYSAATIKDFDQNYPSALAIDDENRTWSDSRVVAKLDAWTACMKTAGGFTYAKPLDASSDQAWGTQEHPVPTATQREKAVAVADAKCNNQVGLSDTAAAVAAAYQNRTIEQNSQRLADFKASKDLVLRKAASVIGQ